MTTSDLKFTDPAPFYKTYIDVLGEGVELMDMLRRQYANFPKFIANIPEAKLHFAYADGKWTVAQVLMHIFDAERVFQHRALRFSRGDRTPLPGFDQDVYLKGSSPAVRSKDSLIQEYGAVRMATLTLFSNLEPEALELTGMASDTEWSVAKLGFVICGHQRYHRNMVRERYL